MNDQKTPENTEAQFRGIRPENPYAFPKPALVHPNSEVYWNADGMTLRDYYAAKADVPWEAVRQTLILQGNKESEITVKMLVEYRAAVKYLEADAMLAARQKEAQ